MDITLIDNSATAKLKAALLNLRQEGSEVDANWTSLVDVALSLSDSLVNNLCMTTDEKLELERLAIDLWNKTSLLKGRGSLQHLPYAKLRHTSFQIVGFLNESTSDDKALKRQIIMGLKTTKGWISCKELDFAERVLTTLTQTLQRLQCIIVERNNASVSPHTLEKEKEDIDLNNFNILCLKAELTFAQGHYSEALSAISRAKEIVLKYPHEAAHLSMLCYNFGVDSYQGKLFELGVQWLRESYNAGKDCNEINTKSQARTLRLLATCYMEWECDGWQENAINAVTLANKTYLHTAGIYMRLQLFLLTNEGIHIIKQAFDDLLLHQDCNMDICLNVLMLLKKNQRPDIAFDFRQKIISKFEMQPETGTLLITMTDVLLNAADMNYAKIFAEECITAHSTGQRLDEVTTKQFHILFWGKAAQYYEKQNFMEALVWYNYSLSLYTSMSHLEPNLGKLQRNIAACYIHLGETSKALTAIEVSERCEPRNAHTMYVSFKIALEMNNTEKASTSLHKLAECVSKSNNPEDLNMICLTAQMSLEQEKTHLAIPALECLISHGTDTKCVIIALRCLLRLLVTQLEMDKSIGLKPILMHTRSAYHKLLWVKDKEEMSSTEIHEEATWFMKIAWNIALQCKDDPFSMKEFFNLCSQLLSLCPSEFDNYNRNQKCLLMSCAACLQLARTKEDQFSLQDILEEVLQHVEEYRQAERSAQNSLWSAEGPVKISAAADLFLLMFEFEALTKLKDVKAESVLERAFTLSNSDPKLFHTLSALAVDPPANNYRLGIRALKIAIRLHLQADNPDYAKCSVDVRNLIELALNENQQEAFVYFKEAFDMIDKKAKENYPELEILWLMTKSWNCGLQFYNYGKFQDAEQWCTMSIKFLKYLTSMKDGYEEQMMALYGEILNRLDRQSTVNFVEE